MMHIKKKKTPGFSKLAKVLVVRPRPTGISISITYCYYYCYYYDYHYYSYYYYYHHYYNYY